MRFITLGLMFGLAIGCSETSSVGPQSKPPVSHQTNKPVAPDNTAVNAHDRDSAAKTPIDQNENQADIDVTASIRKQVVDSKMSVAAQNVKIITQDGKVTLRGPVKSADEKQQIEQVAVAVAGSGNVDNQLEVEPNP